MMLAWGSRVSAPFAQRVIAIAAQHAIDPSWLMAVMAFETGRTFSPSVVNPISGATGLIQFMPSTARSMGTTVEALARKTAEEQLDDVERYFAPFLGRLRALSDVYMAVLWPAAVGRSDDDVIFASGSNAYLQNRGLDLDGDKSVTKGEATAHVARLLAEGLQPGNVATISDEQAPAPIEDVSVPARPEDVERVNQETANVDPVTGITLAIALGQKIFEIFSPVAKAAIKEKLGGKIGAEAADQLATAALDTGREVLQRATGGLPATPATPGAPAVPKAAPTDVQVVAALEADAAARDAGVPGAGKLIEQVEERTIMRLEAIAPYVDKIAEMESRGWAAEEASRDAAAKRAKSDTVDLGYPIAIYVLAGFAIIGVSLIVLLGIQIYYDPEHRPDGTLLANIGIVIGVIVSKFGTIVDYRFGSSRGSAAKDVLINEMTANAAAQPIISAPARSRVSATVTPAPGQATTTTTTTTKG